MRRSQRLIAATVLIALSGALAGCGSMGNFDPTDMLDFLDTKKKLPGERKPVFPEGVPGLEQGVPKELYKGARSSRSTIRTPRRGRRRAAAAGAEIEGAAKSKGKPSRQRRAPALSPPLPPSPMPRPRKRAAPPRRRRRRSRRRSCASAPPRRRPIKSGGATGRARAIRSNPPRPFPAPMPSGTFTR